MEFLVEFDVHVPEGNPEAEIERRVRTDAEEAGRSAANRPGRGLRLMRLWRAARPGLARPSHEPGARGAR